MSELELKHIAPYLPYGLKVKTTNEVSKDKIHTPKFIDAELEMIYLKEIPFKINQPLRECHLPYIKPILRPMSDLFKLIDWDNSGDPYMLGSKMGLIQIIEDGNPLIVDELYAEQCESPGVCLDARYCNWWLFEHHFDVFGLIEKGLAIKKESEVDNE